jgi:hypothetical protein
MRRHAFSEVVTLCARLWGLRATRAVQLSITIYP